MGKNGFILLTATSLLFASAMADTTAELDAAPPPAMAEATIAGAPALADKAVPEDMATVKISFAPILEKSITGHCEYIGIAASAGAFFFCG